MTHLQLWTFAGLWAAAIYASSSVGLAHADDAAERRYDAGPLTADDFRATPPQPLPRVGRYVQLGYADTDIRFQLEYRFTNQADGVLARLVDIDIFAGFVTDKSWLSRRDAPALDHEQGHFDITQAHALEARLVMKKQLAVGKTLVGRGQDVDAALADLQSKVKDFLKPVYDRAATAQGEYDRQTHNGILTANQAEHRKRQIDVLMELNAELKVEQAAEQ